MTEKNYVGVTLLFYKMNRKTYTAFLKSYIVEIQNWGNIQEYLSKIIFFNKELEYLGIEDIFYVSGMFGENQVLGKSYIDDVQTIKSAKNLLLKRDKYTFNYQPYKYGDKWYLFSLIYFYNDKIDKDKLTISCLVAIRESYFKDAISKVKKLSNKTTFLKKILPFNLDNMYYKNLKFVGIEDISYIEEDVDNYGAFEVLYKKYNDIEDIKNILPPLEIIEKSYSRILNFHKRK